MARRMCSPRGTGRAEGAGLPEQALAPTTFRAAVPDNEIKPNRCGGNDGLFAMPPAPADGSP